jgi:Zn-dependent protease
VVLGLLAAIGGLAVAKGTIDRATLIFIAVIVPSIILHEISHGAVANAFGDDTAKRAGRLTLNPLPHIDPVGTLIMPTMLALSGLTPFGYAKPVPVNLGKLRHPRNEGLLVSLAGPVTNFTLALIAAALFRITTPFAVSPLGSLHLTTLGEVMVDAGALNVFLGVFNLRPVPPLDGSAMVERLLPRAWWPGYLTFRRYSMFLVLILVFRFHGIIDVVSEPAFRLWGHVAGIQL